jgi:hypothetical protein
MADKSALRMATGVQNIAQFYPVEWLDLPPSIAYKFPDLKAWSDEMKQRWDAMQIALADRDRLQQIKE